MKEIRVLTLIRFVWKGRFDMVTVDGKFWGCRRRHRFQPVSNDKYRVQTSILWQKPKLNIQRWAVWDLLAQFWVHNLRPVRWHSSPDSTGGPKEPFSFVCSKSSQENGFIIFVTKLGLTTTFMAKINLDFRYEY